MAIPSNVKVWDLPVRLFHWLLVAGFFFAYLAEGDWLIYHIWVGYGVFGLLCFRLLWGFAGSRFALFSDFVRGPIKVLRYLFAVLMLRAERHLGHNPAGGIMIVALIVSILLTVWTGVLFYGADAWLGPMAWLMQNTSDDGVLALESLHGWLANLTVLLVLVHVGGVLWESALHRENLIKAMFTGSKRLGLEATDAAGSAEVQVPGHDVWVDPKAVLNVEIGKTDSGNSLVRLEVRGENLPRAFTFSDRGQALAFYRALCELRNGQCAAASPHVTSARARQPHNQQVGSYS